MPTRQPSTSSNKYSYHENATNQTFILRYVYYYLSANTKGGVLRHCWLLLCCSLITTAVVGLYYKMGRSQNINVVSYTLTTVLTEHQNLSSLPVSLDEEASCSWKFVSYVPSDWEKFWSSRIEFIQSRVCPILAQQSEITRSIDALTRIISLQETVFKKDSPWTNVDNLFSKMLYRRKCLNEEHNAVQVIEPLIGKLRDPLTLCGRLPSVPPHLYLDGDFAVQSKRFILLAPSSPFEITPSILSEVEPLVPWIWSNNSKLILVDIGISYFNGRSDKTAEISTKWFYDYFKNKSMSFHRIIAYETQLLDNRRLWKELPIDVFPIYTFINVGIETSTGIFNPWKMLESIAKPDDYVLVKLDIANQPLQDTLIKQLLEDNNPATTLVDELLFGKYPYYTSRSKDTLEDTYKLFNRIRQLGIRMHGWP